MKWSILWRASPRDFARRFQSGQRKRSAAEVMASRGDMIAFVFHRLGHNSAAAAKRHETRCATSRSPARSCHSQSEYEIALIRYLTADIEYDDAVDDIPKLRLLIDRRVTSDRAQGVETKCDIERWDYRDVSADEFTLSAFGMTEPSRRPAEGKGRWPCRVHVFRPGSVDDRSGGLPCASWPARAG